MSRKRKTEEIPEGSKEAEEENPESEWQRTTTQYILKLPCHLIMDIFLRLPLKTIFSCRCVCKTWHNLLSDPHFAQLHLSTSPIRLLLKTIHPRRESKMLHLIDLQGANTRYLDAKFKLTQKTNLPNVKVCLVNSCNGLLCFSQLTEHNTKDVIYICNPMLGEYITLPKAQMGMRCRGVGFGFSQETNEYKVIRILWLGHNYEAEIYTLGAGAWRSIGNVPYSMARNLPFYSFLNGALHWVVDDFKGPHFIRYFHFGSEQFGTIPAPATFGPSEKAFMDYMRLGVLGGCLYVCDFSESDHIDLWIMKSYGVQESWSKDFVIENLIFERKHLDCYEPIKILESGEILMIFNEDSLVLYSPQREVFDFLDIFGVKSEFRAIAHVASFVSLKHVAKGENLKVQRNNRPTKRSRMSMKEASNVDDHDHDEQDQTPGPSITNFRSHIFTLEEDDDNGEQDQTPSPSVKVFPSHIIMDILSRLSVKTIFTCRCVCKCWYNLLSDPLFAKLHFTRAPTYPLLQNTKDKRIQKNLYLVELERDSTCNIGHGSCDIKDCNGNCGGHVNMKLSTKFILPKLGQATVKSKKGLRYIDREFNIVNSCYGLLCLCGSSDDDPIVIYNPVVGEYVTLPKPEKDKNTKSITVCGLGFSAKTNQYKVLQMLCPNIWGPMVAEIHTLGSGLWRRIGNVPYSLASTAFPIFLNSTLHWFCNEYGSRDLIVSFDFEDEQFRAITPPLSFINLKNFDFWKISKISMGALRGCLYLCDSSCYDPIDIWVMKDYGVEESWTKEFEIETDGGDIWPVGLYQPIDFLNNGDLLMYHENNALISYDSSEFKYFKIREIESRFRVIAHIPSFVSLKDLMGDNVEVLNVRSRFSNVEPRRRTTKAPFLVEENRDMMTDSNSSS